MRMVDKQTGKGRQTISHNNTYIYQVYTLHCELLSVQCTCTIGGIYKYVMLINVI